MRLRQVEYCHVCRQHVTFEFDDAEGRQLILCPKCGHKHYREIDATTILLSMQYRPGMREVFIAKPMEISSYFNESGSFSESAPLIAERREVVAERDGKPVVKAKKGEVDTTHVVTERRWGRDQRQVG